MAGKLDYTSMSSRGYHKATHSINKSININKIQFIDIPAILILTSNKMEFNLYIWICTLFDTNL